MKAWWNAWRGRRLLARLRREKEIERVRLRAQLLGVALVATEPQRRKRSKA